MDGAKVVAVAAGTVFVKTTWLPFRFSLAMTDGADAKVHLHCEQRDQTIAEHLVLAERYLAFHQPDAMYSFHDVGKGQGHFAQGSSAGDVKRRVQVFLFLVY
ncbi:unnamed protein product [Miscanthus lutarioriparius]|uniref:Uncharacterized protein n=1 Tax=Miscanthus lutarioriparius TaxID=422564 RepID=A0A811QVT2_9POAL|nr:unnamed protein product [Miscanthus lutarioriparius]